MEHLVKYIFAAAASVLSLLAPVRPLIVCTFIFVAVDFVTGVMASRKRAAKAGVPWAFESNRAWDTVVKLAFIMGGIVLAWLIDAYMLEFARLNLAKAFTGFVCGVELWSYLENAAEISEHPVFNGLKRFMKNKIDKL